MPTPTSVPRGSFKKCQGQGWVCTVCPGTARRGQGPFPNLKAALHHERTVHGHGPTGVGNGNDAGSGVADGRHIAEKHSRATDGSWYDKIDHLPLTSEGLRHWEMHAHVDHVFDLVPFWQRGMDAAARGEVLRLEEFLEQMEGDGGWRTANEVLGMLGGWKASPSERPAWGEPCRDDWAASQRGAWGVDGFEWAASQRGGWGVASSRVASNATESSRGVSGGWGIREEWGAQGRMDAKRGRRDAGGDGIDWADQGRIKMVQAVRDDDRRDELHHFADAIARQEAMNEERRKQMHLFFEMPMEEKIQKIEETIQFLRTHGA